jgi:hypothetical protein
MEKEKFYLQPDNEQASISDVLEKGTSGKTTTETEKNKFESLSGNETAELASKIYEILGRELGCRLAEPNLILLLSGIKSHADIHWVKFDKEKIEELKLANSRLESLGLNMIFPKKLKEDSEIRSITFENFKGIERKSKTTNIPGIPLYNSKAGKEILNRWNQQLDSSLEEAQKVGKIPSDIDLKILFEGIYFGYPDQAIFDFEKHLRTEGINDVLVKADILSSIPEAKKYQGAVPEFSYYLEHKNDPEIVDYISSAKEILKDFYQSNWFKELSQTQEFQDTRQEAAQIKKEGLEKRSFEK